MDKYQKLIASHAYWSDEYKRLKRLGEDSASKCIGPFRVIKKIDADSTPFYEAFEHYEGPTCIQEAFDRTGKAYSDHDYHGFTEITFEDTWTKLLESETTKPCEHCQAVRDYKKQRIEAKRHLGAIRAAMTKMGRELMERDK